MKKIIFASVVTFVAAIAFAIMTKQVAYGDLSHIKSQMCFIWICMAMVVPVVLWIQIPIWIQQAKDWIQRPKWRR